MLPQHARTSSKMQHNGRRTQQGTASRPLGRPADTPLACRKRPLMQTLRRKGKLSLNRRIYNEEENKEGKEEYMK